MAHAVAHLPDCSIFASSSSQHLKGNRFALEAFAVGWVSLW
jgi:hypothetical protein